MSDGDMSRLKKLDTINPLWPTYHSERYEQNQTLEKNWDHLKLQKPQLNPQANAYEPNDIDVPHSDCLIISQHEKTEYVNQDQLSANEMANLLKELPKDNTPFEKKTSNTYFT